MSAEPHKGVSLLGDTQKASAIAESLGSDTKFLFTLVMSYTATSQSPGISAAGASPQSMRLTPAADAEYIRYGECKCIKGVPVTPEGLPTPALLTRTALEKARIPSMVINAGSASQPQLPYVETGIAHGEDIASHRAMTPDMADLVLERGKQAGRHASEVCKCVIIGESVPGGTTTALGVMRGLGVDARVSSSMLKNPVALKEEIVSKALARPRDKGAKAILYELGDPMLGFVGAMAASASKDCKVLLAGGTQMLAAYLLARRLCEMNESNVAIATTSYVADDPLANFADVACAESIPVITADPHLGSSKIGGLRAFAEGHAKEGAGAGGALVAAILGGAVTPEGFCALAESEHARLLSHSN